MDEEGLFYGTLGVPAGAVILIAATYLLRQVPTLQSALFGFVFSSVVLLESLQKALCVLADEGNREIGILFDFDLILISPLRIEKDLPFLYFLSARY